MKYEIPKKHPDAMVINIDNKGIDGSPSKGGTHYVAVRDNFYFDSFGLPPPDALKKLLNLKWYNTEEVQKLNEEICGQLCITFLEKTKHMNLQNLDKDTYQKTLNIIRNLKSI